MKRILLAIALVGSTIVSQGQGVDVGVRISKFNSGAVLKATVGHNRDGNNPYGVELFAGYSYIANEGVVSNITMFKEWSVTKTSEVYVVVQTGIQYGTFKDYYKVTPNNAYTQNNTGILYYSNQKGVWTSTINFIGYVGLDWIPNDYPISLTGTINPWYDLINPGPEWIDINITLKYRLQ